MIIGQERLCSIFTEDVTMEMIKLIYTSGRRTQTINSAACKTLDEPKIVEITREFKEKGCLRMMDGIRVRKELLKKKDS